MVKFFHGVQRWPGDTQRERRGKQSQEQKNIIGLGLKQKIKCKLTENVLKLKSLVSLQLNDQTKLNYTRRIYLRKLKIRDHCPLSKEESTSRSHSAKHKHKVTTNMQQLLLSGPLARVWASIKAPVLNWLGGSGVIHHSLLVRRGQHTNASTALLL